MKQIHRLLLFLFVVLTLTAFGQTPIDFDKVEVRDPNAPRFSEPQGYQTLGIDIGLSYQTSDVRAAWGGWGIGLTYEKNLAHRTGGALDLGFRGRLMYANSKGFDTKPTQGLRDNPINYAPETSFYANHLTHHGELAIEGVLTFNKLRERTGIYATLFGGIGIVGYDVSVDQLNGTAKYDYKSLGANPSVSAVRALHDGTFETRRLGGDTLTLGFMPSIGGEIGFHVTPRFMIVLGHKWLFTGNDLFDGKEYIDATTKGVRNDWHHYTNLQLKWIVGERTRKKEYPPQPNPTATPLPIVRFTLPNSNFETSQNRFGIRVKIDNVYDYGSVNLSVNGRDSRDFAFRNGELTADIALNEGANTVTVSARNTAGSASDALTITSRQPRAAAPTVQITSLPTPTADNSGNCQTTLEARINNVSSSNDIRVTLNGRDFYDFTYNSSSKILRGPLALSAGSNRVVITARNDVGSNADERSVSCAERPRAAAPTVQITSLPTPTADNFGNCKTTLEARINNVSSSNNISVTLNGRDFYDFTYNNNAKILRGSLPLASGSNRVVITARNDAGNGSDERSVSCTERPRTAAPTVRINQPTNGQVFENNPIDIRARVENISNRNQVEMYVNGNRITDFSYYNFDKSVTARVSVNVGENQVRIVATNDGGSMEDAVRFTLREKARSNAPTVQILRPSNNARIGDNFVNLEAKVDNVTDKNGIQVLVNGAEDRGFSFDIYTKMVRTRATIRDGQNTLTVRASNETGNAEASVTVSKRGIIIAPTKAPPTVAISNPANGSRTTAPSVNLAATADNVVKSQVRVLLNGQEIEFSMTGRQIQAVLNLARGDNSVTVRATNDDGTAEKTTTVVYNKGKQLPDTQLPDVGTLEPLQQPVIGNISATQPVTDPFDPKPAVSVVSTTITNVTNANQIEFYVNGAQQTNFTFNADTKQLRWSFEPRGGQSYTIYITAKNDAGKTTKTEVVKF